MAGNEVRLLSTRNDQPIVFSHEIPAMPAGKVFTLDEVAPLAVPTAEKLSLLETTKKIDSNDFNPVLLREINRAAWKTAPVVYQSAGRRKTFRDLSLEYPERRPYLIHGMLRQGETMNLVSNAKRGKSWLALTIACNIITGQPLFGRFQCERGKVLIVDDELHPEELVFRVKTMAAAMTIPLDALNFNLEVIHLRGRLVDIDGLAEEFSDVQHDEFKLVILDALYRLFPPQTDENDNADMAQLYNKLDVYASSLGASILVIHHATKGIQAQKSVTDVGAGGGAQSRAADNHVILRQHEDDDCAVLDMAPRSSQACDPLGLRFSFPLWSYDPNIDPAKLLGMSDSGPYANANAHTKKFEVAKAALLGGLLTLQPQAWTKIWAMIKTAPYNVDIGEKKLMFVINSLVNDGLVIRKQDPAAPRSHAFCLPDSQGSDSDEADEPAEENNDDN